MISLYGIASWVWRYVFTTRSELDTVSLLTLAVKPMALRGRQSTGFLHAGKPRVARTSNAF